MLCISIEGTFIVYANCTTLLIYDTRHTYIYTQSKQDALGTFACSIIPTNQNMLRNNF